jgi:hypothetical protein
MKNVVFWMLPGNFEGTYQHEDKARSFLWNIVTCLAKCMTSDPTNP